MSKNNSKGNFITVDSVKELEDNLFQKLKENRYDYNILNRLGYIYLHSDNRIKSEEFYLKSIIIEKDQFEPYVSLSLIATISGRLEKALYYLYKAKENSQESSELNKSIEEIVLAIISKEGKISNAQLESLQKQAFELLENGIVDEAIEIYIKLSCIFPENENILISSSLAFIKNLDFIIAEGILLSLISRSNNALAYHYLAIVANFLDKKDDAKKYFEKSLELKPALADISFNGRYAIYRKSYDEEIIDKCPNCANPKSKLINILNQSQSSINFNCINPIRFWHQCTKCNLAYANPRPSDDSLIEYNFELENYISQIKNNDIEKIIFENNIANQRMKNIEKLSPTPTLLDLKSSDVKFISVAQRRQWKIKGLDENNLRSLENKQTYQLDIENIVFDNFKTDQTFGVVTLWEEIEKVKNFKQLLKKVKSILEPNGVFAFSFHDLDSYISKTLGYEYPVWFYPNYLYFFSIATIKEIIKSEGFSLAYIDCLERKYQGNTDFYCIKSQKINEVTV